MQRVSRRLVLVTALCASLASAHAQERRSFAALSLVGDELTLITLQPSTGSHTDTSEREKIAMPNSSLDEAALKTIERVVQGRGHEAPLLLVPGGKPFYANQAGMLSGGRFTPNAALKPAFEQLKGQATHLILVTRQRSAGGLRGMRLPNGPRTLEGIGFCLDAGWREKAGNAVVDASGLLAPFASLRVSLIDLRSGQVLKSEVINGGRHLPTPAGYSSPWDALPDEIKMGGLNDLVKTELERVVPTLLGS